MGLDMYLEKEIFVGAQYEHRNVQGVIDLSYATHYDDENSPRKAIPVNLGKVSSITEHVGYWRKANAIHNWFVQNVQNGVDDCGRYYVSHDQLKKLRAECQAVLDGNTELLPPTPGFFFGSTERDEWYFQDMRDTIKIIDEVTAQPEEHEHYYQASW